MDKTTKIVLAFTIIISILCLIICILTKNGAWFIFGSILTPFISLSGYGAYITYCVKEKE